MAGYPQIIEYNDAVQHPATAFFDPELRQGQVKENALGLPVALSGGFALTYMVTVPKRRIAVRCFHRQIPAVEQKYAAIAKTVNALKSPYFVDFEYLAQGIRVLRTAYPIVKMDWVEGDPLGVWLDKNSGDRGVLESIRADLVKLAAFLETHGIAHCDIQNGNVMISPSGVRLVDYDGIYVPGMRSGDGSESGHKHFQHPDRTAAHFGPHADRFSFIAVDLSLRALIEDPTLHRRFRQGGETILFCANDFADPEHSEVFTLLARRPGLKFRAARFAAICRGDIAAVPSLEDFLAGNDAPVAPAANALRTRARSSPAPYIGAYPVLSAEDFSGVVSHVGCRVELVGRAHAVRHGVGQWGRVRGQEYVFITFGRWRGEIVRLTVWSDALTQLTASPDATWVGRWISVVGLVDQPCAAMQYWMRRTHVGITIETANQINFISEAEAMRRLRRDEGGEPVRSPSLPPNSTSAPAIATHGVAPRNRLIVARLLAADAQGPPPSLQSASAVAAHGAASSTVNRGIVAKLQSSRAIFGAAARSKLPAAGSAARPANRVPALTIHPRAARSVIAAPPPPPAQQSGFATWVRRFLVR